MNRIIICIYDRFRKSPALAWGLFLSMTILLLAALFTLAYKEDISDFLPLDEKNQTALAVYQDVSGANRIYAIVGVRDTTEVDPQQLADGVAAFSENVARADSMHYIREIVSGIDMDRMLGIADYVYDNIPYFLTDSDYARIDSLLASPGYVARQLEEDKGMLMFPSSNVLASNIARDPLNLFSPVLGRLGRQGMSIDFETYDGCILTPDGKRAVVMMESAFGASESENNAALVGMLDAARHATEKENPGLDIHIIGGPVIAVANADRIKKDSILAVSLAGILILTLLIYVFRNARNILLIVVSVGWGWLFAMGGIALFYDSVSVIVIGIASVILGIAVNYPLHLIDHLRESDHPRAALREIISPLVVGNVTTVGAFLCLVPLDAPALHDLGLFSSLLLVGTILFVLLFLPHLVRTRRRGERKPSDPKLISRIASLSLEKSRWAVWCVLLLTVVFAYFSLRTEFDSDMRNINYMTPEQKDDMVYFQSLVNMSEGSEDIYAVSSGRTWDDALSDGNRLAPVIDSLVSAGTVAVRDHSSAFLVPASVRNERLAKWNSFINRHAGILGHDLPEAARNEGFSEGAFSAFDDLIAGEYGEKDFDDFREFISTVFAGSLSEDSGTGRKSVVRVLSVPTARVGEVKEILEREGSDSDIFFDVASMNGSIADTLSDDFNYIGFACGCIVFIFLWISLGSVELAIVSFLPMAFSWIWILGIMGMLGMKFNIVNVILATFIFGQGDDYTIFMTEGLSYELAYRKKVLASYKNSIVVSALIMFIGIGTLLFARHPALRSLGEVTVVGMLSVVLMAYLFPPLVFNWLVKRGGKLRYRSITLGKLLRSVVSAAVLSVQIACAYILGIAFFAFRRHPSEAARQRFRRYVCSAARFDVRHLPGIRLVYRNESAEDFSRPAVVTGNCRSVPGIVCLLSLTPEIVFVSDIPLAVSPVIGRVLKWCGFMTMSESFDLTVERVRSLVAEGRSIAVLTEQGSVGEKRDSELPFRLADALGLDVVPVVIEGLSRIMPDGGCIVAGGVLYIGVCRRIYSASLAEMGDVANQTLVTAELIRKRLEEARLSISDVEDIIPVVYDRYIYKGRDIEVSARKTLGFLRRHSEELRKTRGCDSVFVCDSACQGELALLLSVMHPDSRIICAVRDHESRIVLEGCAKDFAPNLTIADGNSADLSLLSDTCRIDLGRSAGGTLELNVTI